jgi:Lar family restriction alleviation protein
MPPIEPKPCPFCGCEEIMQTVTVASRRGAMICLNCEALGPEVTTMGGAVEARSRTAAIEEWNKRSEQK